jgi:voltage-gated potassium channel
MEERLEKPLLVAALLTIPAIALEQSNVGQPWDTLVSVLNWVIWTAFVAEAVLMLSVVDGRWRWIREHPLEVAIIVLTPPFLPASMQAARVFRLFRLLRLLRLGVLTRRFLSTEGIRDAAVLAAMTVLGGGAAFAAVEKGQHLSAWDGVWWAITTVTTVGYGDIKPETDVGRIIAMVVMTVGIGFVALLTAAAAERFMRSQRAERRELEVVEQQLTEILRRLDGHGVQQVAPRAEPSRLGARSLRVVFSLRALVQAWRGSEAIRMTGDLDLTNPQPGWWISRAGYPVDLLLPEAVRDVRARAGRDTSRRTTRCPPAGCSASRARSWTTRRCALPQ